VGGGIVAGTAPSANASTLTFASFPAVTWTFTGGLKIIDNLTYTAVLAPNLNFKVSNSNPSVYPDGSIRINSFPLANFDLVFQGTFSSATPVPFEFSPALGLGVLGGLFALKKLVKKKAS
jgi:hypothetical protein